MMIVASARQLAGERVCFVGVGPPNIACNLAKRTVAPDLELLYEAGRLRGASPARLPLSIGDPTLVTGSLAGDEHVRAVRSTSWSAAASTWGSSAARRSTGSAT